MEEFIMGLVGGVVAFILGLIILKDKEVAGTTEKKQDKSKTAVTGAEKKAEEAEQEANDEYENASNDSVVERFKSVFSKRPRNK